MGGYERLVVGVAVVNSEGFHVEPANAVGRLHCFYGDDAFATISAIEIAIDHLRNELALRSVEALTDPNHVISGVHVGELRTAEGDSLQAIGKSWMAVLSSLYQEQVEASKIVASNANVADPQESSGDRLPFLVCDYVKAQRAGYAGFFSSDLREGKQRRNKGSSHKVIIDFSGSKLVANFGTLKAGALTASVNIVKRRLWDLKVERDRDPNSVLDRKHEMILQRPHADDPQLSEKQQENLNEAFEELEHQADQEELRLRALNTVVEIGDHVLKLEAA
ncbi:hypothetical protein [Cribrihabitans neustonicus]|uniref:hypothetical protein n=1 Tax=Cribrihabitans neustonicus TaxID=1429085 RepID=UPI003B58B705